MNVLLFLANGFEHMESSVFIDVLGWARHRSGIDVTLTTCGFTQQVTSTFDVPVLVDRLIDDVVVADYDAIAIPGGFWDFGFFDEAFDERFLALIREFHAQGKILASICVAALALGKSGILQGRNATTYHLDGGKRHQELRAFGATVVDGPVVVDGTIITSYCPETAPRVAFTLLEMLTSAEKAGAVKKIMGYPADYAALRR